MAQRRRAGKDKGKGRKAKAPARPTRALSKWAGATFYDTATRSIRNANGERVNVEPGRITPITSGRDSSVGASPVHGGAKPTREQDKLYACEAADRETIVRLAALAGCSIQELEWRRHGYRQATERTPTPACYDLPPDRRRCLNCPYWTDNPDATPF